MKKSLAIGAASLAIATMPVLSAFAEDLPPQVNGDETYYAHEATVGEVDETVYSVDISWGDMKFDWKYSKDTNKFGFEPYRSCVASVYEHGDHIEGKLYEGGALYQDSACTTLYEQEPSDGATVYSKTGIEDWVSVTDNSTNGRVKVEGWLTSEAKYMWVMGEFVSGGYWTDGESLGRFGISRDNYLIFGNDIYYYYGDSYIDGVIPTIAGLGDSNVHFAHLRLKVNPETDPSDIVVSTEDKIGNVIVTISPDYN